MKHYYCHHYLAITKFEFTYMNDMTFVLQFCHIKQRHNNRMSKESQICTHEAMICKLAEIFRNAEELLNKYSKTQDYVEISWIKQFIHALGDYIDKKIKHSDRRQASE